MAIDVRKNVTVISMFRDTGVMGSPMLAIWFEDDVDSTAGTNFAARFAVDFRPVVRTTVFQLLNLLFRWYWISR